MSIYRRTQDAETARTNPVWLRDADFIKDLMLSADNGASTNFNTVYSGTPIGRATSGAIDGLARPCGKATLTAAASATTTLTIGDGTKVIFDGDVLTLTDTDGSVVATGLTVSNRDTGAGTIDVDSSVTAALGAVLTTEDGSDVCIGYLLEGEQTFDADDIDEDTGVITHSDKPIRIVQRGAVLQDELEYYISENADDLGQILHTTDE